VKLALYTTIYPGVETFLAGWYASVLGQTDQDFDLWIGLDLIDPATALRHMGAPPAGAPTAAPTDATPGTAPTPARAAHPIWVESPRGATIPQVRQTAWEKLVDSCDAVVLVDSDDLLLPSRVATAREMLRDCDLAGCALELVDAAGDSLGLTFDRPSLPPERVLPRHNLFGLSNSAYRSDLLRRCLPVPAEAELVDWYLATRAWLLGARMAFGPRVEMKYRQHGANMVQVAPPFDAQRIAGDTARVRHHLRLVLTHGREGAQPARLAELMQAATDVDTFYERVVLQPAALARYVEAVNALDMPPLWWSGVAHRSLQHMWMPSGERT
jgi:hypothetical protein